ncbi:hypothetical protein ACSFA8_25660 [Variovorax sp. RT4R15]|uniref:hypothetical protein n=1 Tax=Variovorax sp. RT4R15 TaxID=3443737 RepID=UPI003F4737E0
MSNFERGMQRLYYAFWALWTIGFTAVGLYQVLTGYRFHADEIATWFALAIVAPPALMLVIRWVYRGFRSRT